MFGRYAWVLVALVLLGGAGCGGAAPKPAPKPATKPIITARRDGPRWVFVAPGDTVRSYPNRYGGTGAPGKTSKVPSPGQAPGQENGYWLYIGPPGGAPRQ